MNGERSSASDGYIGGGTSATFSSERQHMLLTIDDDNTMVQVSIAQ